MLDTAITKRINMEIWEETQAKEKAEQQQLERLVSRIRH
jgi:hypothetical protein